MDEALSFRHQKLRLVAIGSSVLILDGMPERGTTDNYPLFDPHIKNQIDRNTFVFDLYLNARKSKIIDHPKSEASLILPQKSKQPKTS